MLVLMLVLVLGGIASAGDRGVCLLWMRRRRRCAVIVAIANWGLRLVVHFSVMVIFDDLSKPQSCL
jgi:hypothetical protein